MVIATSLSYSLGPARLLHENADRLHRPGLTGGGIIEIMRGSEANTSDHKTSVFYVNADALGALAQLVEQRTLNPFVVGSTPTCPTRFQKRLAAMRAVFVYWHNQKRLAKKLVCL